MIELEYFGDVGVLDLKQSGDFTLHFVEVLLGDVFLPDLLDDPDDASGHVDDLVDFTEVAF